MMYRNRIGRVEISLNEGARQDHSSRYSSELSFFDRHDDGNPGHQQRLSIEELRDLRHLLDRAIANAEDELASARRAYASVTRAA